MRNRVKAYDVVVIGSGSGASIAEAALRQGLKVALVEGSFLGGTCANVGCVPSKMLIVPADRVMEIRAARRLGISASVQQIDFRAIMERMRRLRSESQREMREGIKHAHNLDLYETMGQFVAERTLLVGSQRIHGEKVFVVAGARPLIPRIRGLEAIDYLTNETVLELDERPDSMVFIGGGYIACEFAHFFSAMGTSVTIVQRNDRLLPGEEPEISELLRQELSGRMGVFAHTEAVRVERADGGYKVTGRDTHTGEEKEFLGQQVLVASGRKSNADLLKVENAGIETDARGFVKVNEYLETSAPNVWAFGDVIGKRMFKHSANREAVYAWHNSQNGDKVAMDYSSVPSAVFTCPQIASVGLREEEAKSQYHILVGRARYSEVAKGTALMEEEGFAKAIVDAHSRRILGFHIIGPYAPILIQEVINVMAAEGEVGSISRGLHIHPAMPELVARTLGNLAPPE